MTHYFLNFFGLGDMLIVMDRVAPANGLWERAVHCVTGWEQATGQRANKGAGI
jgi:hypothetical protein